MIKKVFTAVIFIISLMLNLNAYALAYLGLDSGYNTGPWKWQNTNHDAINFKATGYNGGLFAGYGIGIEPNFYIGGEIFANRNAIDTNKKTIEGEMRGDLQSSYSYGLSLIPAYSVYTNTIIFLRVGLVESGFQTKEFFIDDDEKSTQVDNVLGVQYGFGAETQLLRSFDIRVEYVYSNYKSFNVSGNRIFPQNNQFNVGFIYRIGCFPYQPIWVRNPSVANWDGKKMVQ